MITFEEARAIVAANRASAYPPEAEFHVATWGWENAEYFLIRAGAYGEVYPPRSAADEAFLFLSDGPVITVNKATGEYEERYGLDENGLPFSLEDSTPVGVRQSAP